MKPPSSEDMIKFLEAYFGEHVTGTITHGSHFIINADNCDQPISVPMNRDRLAIGTFENILRCAKIAKKEFQELAGTKEKLKEYLKERRRSTKD
jgi:predicted RNA binding protein YcfA (HicA-like mRNA interferase family)